MSVYGWIGVAFAALLSFWQWDHNRLESSQREQAARIDQAEIDRLGLIVEQQARARREQADLQVTLSAIDVQARQISVALQAQSVRLRQDLSELRRTDEQVNAYLSGVVPAAIGLRYVRTGTTDPLAWRAGAARGVRADALPAAGAASAGQ